MYKYRINFIFTEFFLREIYIAELILTIIRVRRSFNLFIPNSYGNLLFEFG